MAAHQKMQGWSCCALRQSGVLLLSQGADAHRAAQLVAAAPGTVVAGTLAAGAHPL